MGWADTVARMNAAERQASYYASTARRYMTMHDEHEHHRARAWLQGWALENDVRSVLDVGAGTGANVARMRDGMPNARAVGVEPVSELRAVGHEEGLHPDALIDGSAYTLPFRDGDFDVVTAFAVMHHLEAPDRAIGEMLRVASRAVFISDVNNFGAGASRMKLLLRSLRLWPLVVKVKSRGRGWEFSEGDGVFYSYSLFSSLPLLQDAGDVFVMTTGPYRGPNLLSSASHIAALTVKR